MSCFFLFSSDEYFCVFHALAAMLELGALLGALLAGTFTDRYSRRHSIFAACGMSIVLYSFFFIVDLRFTHVSSLLPHNTTCLKKTHPTWDQRARLGVNTPCSRVHRRFCYTNTRFFTRRPHPRTGNRRHWYWGA